MASITTQTGTLGSSPPASLCRAPPPCTQPGPRGWGGSRLSIAGQLGLPGSGSLAQGAGCKGHGVGVVWGASDVRGAGPGTARQGREPGVDTQAGDAATSQLSRVTPGSPGPRARILQGAWVLLTTWRPHQRAQKHCRHCACAPAHPWAPRVIHTPFPGPAPCISPHGAALAFPLDLGARPLCRRLRGRGCVLTTGHRAVPRMWF